MKTSIIFLTNSKEIYDRLIFSAVAALPVALAMSPDEYKEIYVWLKDLILLVSKLNNLTDVEGDNIFVSI